MPAPPNQADALSDGRPAELVPNQPPPGKPGDDSPPSPGSRRHPVESMVYRVVPAEGASESALNPSRRSSGAYELKFLVDDDCAHRVMDWARVHLDSDPHATERDDGYHVNSLYLDTPKLDVFHRAPSFRQRKYRLRRYGTESLVWLEVKRKRKGYVRKRRVQIEDHSLDTRLTAPVDRDWEGAWFRERLDELGLRPVCQVTYRRFARMGMTSQGSLRLTIDDHLQACPAKNWRVPSGPLSGVPLLVGRRVLELKYQGVFPTLFRQLVHDELLRVTSFSKYRTSVEECISLDRIAGEPGRDA